MTPKEILDHMMEFIDQLDGVTIVDHNGYYLFVSDSWTRAMGYTLEELKGKKLRIFSRTASPILPCAKEGQSSGIRYDGGKIVPPGLPTIILLSTRMVRYGAATAL